MSQSSTFEANGLSPVFQNLFSVHGLVALVTGGGTGKPLVRAAHCSIARELTFDQGLVCRSLELWRRQVLRGFT
jgi:hypothetical protein